MKFNKRKVLNYFGAMTEPQKEVSFEEIETNCGAIPPSYIGESNCGSRGFSGNFAFHKHLEEVGYRVATVDYDRRTLTIERIDSPSTPSVPNNVENTTVITEIHTPTLDERTLASYNKLFSRQKRNQAEIGAISEENLLWYIVYTCASMAAMGGYERPNKGEIWNNREAISRLTVEKLRSFRQECNFDSNFKEICRGNEFGMRFGVWQKMLTVSMKHMYLFYVCSGQRYFRDFAWLWEEGHC